MNNQSDSHDPGPQALLCAVCHQALMDYFILRRMGAVRWCHQTGHWKRRSGKYGSYVFQNMTPDDCRQLLVFIQEHAERVLDLCGINVDKGGVKRRIIAMERSGEWQRYFGQGCKMYRGDVASSGEGDNMRSIAEGAVV